mmetsp:Transcript_64529/g.107226  ORF Transcript_64529/g.107226 Transcript_64529/m.107226 type:complete len:135 (+) Transcript_64529:103-507(+)
MHDLRPACSCTHEDRTAQKADILLVAVISMFVSQHCQTSNPVSLLVARHERINFARLSPRTASPHSTSNASAERPTTAPPLGGAHGRWVCGDGIRGIILKWNDALPALATTCGRRYRRKRADIAAIVMWCSNFL